MTRRGEGWVRDLVDVGAALGVCAAAGLLRYGLDVFRRQTSAFQLLTVALAGSLTLIGYRRGGWRGALLLAYLTLFLQYILLGNMGRRESWPALIWVLVLGLFLLASVAAFFATIRYVRFGRFIFVSLIVGAGFVAATIALGLILGLRPMGLSARVNFAVGSLAGAALGLGLELADLGWRHALGGSRRP